MVISWSASILLALHRMNPENESSSNQMLPQEKIPALPPFSDQSPPENIGADWCSHDRYTEGVSAYVVGDAPCNLLTQTTSTIRPFTSIAI